MLKKFYLLVLVILYFNSPFFSQSQFDIQIKPGISVPTSFSKDGSIFEIGFTAQLMGQLKFKQDSLFFANAVINYSNNPTKADNLSMNMISLGIGPGLDLKLFPFLNMQTGLDLGWYVAFGDELVTTNPFASVFIDFSFRISPSFSLSVGSTYQYFLTSSQEQLTDLYQGVSFFIGASISPNAKVRPADIDFGDIQFLPVFPVFYKYYNDNSLGSISIQNNEKKSIYDVNVSFLVNQYMDAPKDSYYIEELKAEDKIDVPLYALFNMDIMDLTESTMSSAVINIDYTWQETTMHKEVSQTLSIQNRNAMIWDDDRKASAFVTAGDPYVLQLAKNVGGLVRESSNSPINLNFRIGMGIFESLKDYGISYVVDPLTPYIKLSEDLKAVDSLQFPRHTLNYKAGDCDDLTILYSSLLKAVGMETAFITVPGHIYMAFNLGISSDEMKKSFKNTEDFIIMEDEVWVPVEITQIQEGFLNAWQIGARLWRENIVKSAVKIYPIDSAQEIYQPVGLRSENLKLDFPSNSLILESYQSTLSRFISRDIHDEVLKIQERIESSDGRPRDVNKLGVLYARYGLYDQATEQFEEIIEQEEYPQALVNLGNICFLKEDYTSAQNWYSRAAVLDPDNKSILVGLARTNYELENYAVANRLYDMLIVASPSIAEKYSYLVFDKSSDTRAGIQLGFIDMLWDEVD